MINPYIENTYNVYKKREKHGINVKNVTLEY